MDIARCPGCSAAIRPGAPWCGLCYRDLRPAQPARKPEATSSPQSEIGLPTGSSRPLNIEGNLIQVPAPRHPAVSNGTLADEPPGSPSWPCHCGALAGIQRDTCPQCGAPFLSALEGLARHRPTKSSGLSRGARLGLAIGLGLVVAIVVPLLLTMLG